MMKRMISMLISTSLMMSGMGALCVNAEDDIPLGITADASGTCGDDLTWSISDHRYRKELSDKRQLQYTRYA